MHVEFNVIPMQVIQIFKNIERCTFLQILKKKNVHIKLKKDIQ